MKNTESVLSIIVAGILLVTIPVVVAFSPAGPDKVVKQERTVGSFSGLEVGGAFKVYLTQGNSESIVVEADEEDIDRIVTEVVGNKLMISTRSCSNINGPMNIYLTFRDLKYIEVSGAVEIEAEQQLNFDELELEISGAAEVDLPMSAKKLACEISGAGDVELEGNSDLVNFEISGAAKVNAGDFVVTNMNVEISGAADAKVHVTGELIAKASGASSLHYLGNPRVDVHTSAASRVHGD